MPKLIAQDLAATLHDRIDAGEWRRTGRLPAERELAKEFGVARNTVRHAVSILEEDGILIREIGRGTFVRNQPKSRHLGSAMADVSDVSPRDLIDARLMVEPAVAATAAANATDADIVKLEHAQAASQATDEIAEFEYYDAEIHKLLFAMAQNQVIVHIDEILAGFRSNADWLAAKRQAYSPALKARYVAQHAEIIDAIRRRSPKAARAAMITHLEEVRRALLES